MCVSTGTVYGWDSLPQQTIEVDTEYIQRSFTEITRIEFFMDANPFNLTTLQPSSHVPPIDIDIAGIVGTL